MKTVFINDKYKEVRGGYSRLLRIKCTLCNEFICNYQKDGPGGLRRMYIDRIMKPEVSLSGESLSCPNKHVLGIRINYGGERPAFRLFAEAVIKKIIKSGIV
ncbi:MAG: hypothetical protein WCO09_04120 [bacterium]